MSKILGIVFLLTALNSHAYNVIDINGEKFCEAKKDARFAIKMDYEMGDYTQLNNKVLNVYNKKTEKITKYKFLGRSNGYSFDVFINKNAIELPTHIGLSVSQFNSGVSLFNGFNDLGNMIDSENEKISYSVSASYRPWERCGGKLLNPED